MEANARHLERLFDQTVSYQIPLFQRPYVWTLEINWEPLWDDIQALLDKQLRGGKVHPHFLGAVVLEQLPNAAGTIDVRQVIDGQQRFTTLQLFLIAARDHATALKNEKFIERFTDFVENSRNRIDQPDELFKVWPTNSDRPAFRLVHAAGSPAALDKALKAKPAKIGGLNNIVEAYRYFHTQIGGWIEGVLDNEEDSVALAEKSKDDRFDALWQVVKSKLHMVVIDLDKEDETQIIFETLNARGVELLPADLIKNFLFRKAVGDNEDVEKLYEIYWQRFETPFWREEIQQGRIKRPRIDTFINHYLALMTRDEVRSSHLFNAFKTYALTKTEPTDGSEPALVMTTAEHVEQLARYSEVFDVFSWPEKQHPRLALFLRRLEAIDTQTLYPFLLHVYAELMPDRREEFDGILAVLESFLMRRLIVNLTPKGYNRLFIDLIRAVDKRGDIATASVVSQLGKATGESSRYPSDEELRIAVFELPLYGRLAQYKVRVVLEALDTFAQTSKSEVLPLPSGLTIEHVMPQTWQTHWSLPPESTADPITEQKAATRRSVMLNTLGNLTLITGSLNPSLSNSAWSVKRPELLKFNKLNLTQYFHGQDANTWDEVAIRKRTEVLFSQLVRIWPDVEREQPMTLAQLTSNNAQTP